MPPTGRERRRHVRLASKASAAGRFSGEGTAKLPEKVPAADLSEGGAQLTFPWIEGVRFPLKVGGRLGFHLRVEGAAGDFAVQSLIRRIEMPPEGDVVRVGVEFCDLEPTALATLKKAIMGLAVAKLRPAEPAAEPPPSKKPTSYRASFEPPGAPAPAPAAPAPAAGDAEEAAPKRRKPFLGEILVKQGALTPEQLEELLASKEGGKAPLGQKLAARGIIDDVAIAKALAEQARLTYLDLAGDPQDMRLVAAFPREVFVKNLCVPVRDTGASVLVAMAKLPTLPVVQELEAAIGKRVRVGIAPERRLAQWLKKLYSYEDGVRAAGLRFQVQLHAEYRFMDKDGRTPLHPQAIAGQTRELGKNELLIAGPLPHGVTVEGIAAGAMPIEVQIQCAELLNPVLLGCRALSAERGERPGEHYISCHIERFPEGGVEVWERLCITVSTVRFRPRRIGL